MRKIKIITIPWLLNNPHKEHTMKYEFAISKFSLEVAGQPCNLEGLKISGECSPEEYGEAVKTVSSLIDRLTSIDGAAAILGGKK